MFESSQEADRKKFQFWKNHLDQWSRSGTSQVEYCKANGLRSNRMTYWKNKFKRQNLPVEFVQIPATRISQSFHSQSRQALRLNVDASFQIEIQDGFSKTTLSRILQVIKGV